MTSSSFFSPSRSRRLAWAASIVTVFAVVAGVLVLVLGAGLPDAWWPHTGQAFATGERGDSCALLEDPAKAYCEHGSSPADGAPSQSGGDAAVWKVVPAAAAVGALVIWRRGTSTGRGRR
ncbi:hypothetical protein ACIOJ9_38920 [Streptomyces sp. NPDC088175]|uniref:hypothetical protein n=1 Tax=unclassified Streptomyces TaxID=2593676 RepID=UPI0037F9FFAD